MAPPAGLSVRGWDILLVLVGAAIAWLVEPVPDFAVALAMAAAWGALGLAPLATIFSGFATCLPRNGSVKATSSSTPEMSTEQ